MNLKRFLKIVKPNFYALGIGAFDSLKPLAREDTWVMVARSLKAVFFVFIFLLLLAIVVVSWKGREYLLGERREKIRGSDVDVYKKQTMGKKWRAIEKQFESKSKGAFKLAVIEADKMVETFLGKSGWRGEGMSEKLQLIKEEDLSTIEDLWKAHKIRNTIVHDFSVKVRKGQARKAIKTFKKTLEELGVV